MTHSSYLNNNQPACLFQPRRIVGDATFHQQTAFALTAEPLEHQATSGFYLRYGRTIRVSVGTCFATILFNNNQPSRQPLIASSASIQPYWTALQNRSIERAMPTKANSTFTTSLGNEVANVFSAMRTSSRADSTLLAPAHPGGTQRESKPADATVHLTPANTVCQPILTMLWTQSNPSHSISRGRAVRSADTLQLLWISMNDNNRIRPNRIKSDPVQHIFISRNLPIDSIYGSSIARESEDMTISEDR